MLTQSTIKDYTRCGRKWWLAHYRQLTRMDEYRSPLAIGNVVHDALARWYAGELDDPIGFVQDQATTMIEEFPDFAEKIARDAEMAGIMLEGYLEWLEETGADYHLEAVEPERVIRVQLLPAKEGRPAVVLQGKLDGKVRKRVVEDRTWTAFLEHKTVGNFTDLPSYAQFDRQLLTYDLLEYLEWLEEHAGEEKPSKPLTDGAILNMLRKVKRTARAKPPFYDRVEIRHNIHELRSHWRHTVAIAEEILAKTARLDAGEDHHRVVPPVPTNTCRWECPFYSICPLFDDGSDVESVIELEYMEHDPLERYATEEET